MTKLLDPHGIQAQAGDMRHLSKTSIGNGDICLRRMGYYMDPAIPKTTGAPRALGVAYHAGLEAFYGDQDDHNAVAFRSLTEQWATYPYLADDMPLGTARVKLSEMLLAYQELGVWDRSQWEVEGSEVAFYAPLTADWFTQGYVDLVLRNRITGRLVIVDHKTAAKKWKAGKGSARTDEQAPLYKWAWWTLTGERPDDFYYDVMTYDGQFERRLIQVTDAQIQAVLDRAISYTAVLDAVPLDRLPTSGVGHFLCSEKWCDHWAICPAGAAAREVA